MPPSKSEHIAELEDAIGNAVAIRGFVEWRNARRYESGIEELLPCFSQLIQKGQAEEAIRLIELTMAMMELNWPKVDDSSGGMTQIFKDLQAMHLKACEQTCPDGKRLARHLYDWAMRSDYDAFHDAPKDYAGVLGKEGMAELGRLIDSDFEKVPQIGPDAGWPGRTEHFRVKAWAKMYAETIGDFERLLSVLICDLSAPYCYLEVAEACKRFGRDELAVTWAEKGLAVFSKAKGDSRLRVLLAMEYAKQGRAGDTFGMLWTNFENSGHHYLEAYKDMEAVGEQLGCWELWRGKALDHLRAGAGPARNGSLVMVLVYEGLLKQAFDEAQARGGCTRQVWEDLGEALLKGEPELAYQAYLRVFQLAMQDYSSTLGRSKVAQATQVMAKLASTTGKTEVFLAWLAERKVEYKRRTGFLNDLKRMGL